MAENKLKTSITIMINSIAEEKKKAGIRVYNLSAGEPKLTTPEVIRQAACEFINRGDIPYPSPQGMPELRGIACNWLNATYYTDYEPRDCLITTGGKFGIYLALEYLLGENSYLREEGDTSKIKVLISSPYWVSYTAITNIMGGEAVIIKTTEEQAWKLTSLQIKEHYTDGVKVLFLNNGVNPSGAIYSQEELEAILKVCQELGILIISDEVYSGLVYSDEKYISLGGFVEYKSQIVLIQSASKSFAMTGWRLGFLFANEAIIKALTALSSQSTTGVSLICQHGALAAFKHAETINKTVNVTMKSRRDILLNAFKDYFGFELETPKATLYVFLSLAKLGVYSLNDEEFALRALEEANVAIVPGSAFGTPGYIRLSFGAEEDDLVGGICELAKFVNLLKAS